MCKFDFCVYSNFIYIMEEDDDFSCEDCPYWVKEKEKYE